MECLELLRRYMKANKITAGPLFHPYGSAHARPMSYRLALHYWEQLCQRAGVKYEIHQLRHTCATQMLNDGIDIEVICQLLGHRDIQTTSRYTKLDTRTLRKELIAYIQRRDAGLVREDGPVWEIFG